MVPLITFIGAAVVGASPPGMRCTSRMSSSASCCFAVGVAILLIISGASTAGGSGAIEDFLASELMSAIGNARAKGSPDSGFPNQ